MKANWGLQKSIVLPTESQARIKHLYSGTSDHLQLSKCSAFGQIFSCFHMGGVFCPRHNAVWKHGFLCFPTALWCISQVSPRLFQIFAVKFQE